VSGQGGLFAAVAVALYVGHHVGDYWVQTDAQARTKGNAGWSGRLACAAHCGTYVATQAELLAIAWLVLDLPVPDAGGVWRIALALVVSGVTHYLADRREHGVMFRLARRLPGKADFLTLGKPRTVQVLAGEVAGEPLRSVTIDQPTLGTGAWALDQSWHLFFGVFVPALIIAS
jgi:hypothetical protein